MATEDKQTLDVECTEQSTEKNIEPESPETPKQRRPLPKFPSERKDEPVHPRAQQKLDDLRRRGIIP